LYNFNNTTNNTLYIAIMEDFTTFDNNMDAFKTYVKSLKNLAKNNAPAKSPGYYHSGDVVIGRDGNPWKTTRVYHIDITDGYRNECYELVWKRLCVFTPFNQ